MKNPCKTFTWCSAHIGCHCYCYSQFSGVRAFLTLAHIFSITLVIVCHLVCYANMLKFCNKDFPVSRIYRHFSTSLSSLWVSNEESVSAQLKIRPCDWIQNIWTPPTLLLIMDTLTTFWYAACWIKSFVYWLAKYMLGERMLLHPQLFWGRLLPW